MTDEEYLTEINNLLAGSYSISGIEKWWGRRRTLLNGLTPQEAWDQGTRAEILNLAYSLAFGAMGT